MPKLLESYGSTTPNNDHLWYLHFLCIECLCTLAVKRGAAGFLDVNSYKCSNFPSYSSLFSISVVRSFVLYMTCKMNSSFCKKKIWWYHSSALKEGVYEKVEKVIVQLQSNLVNTTLVYMTPSILRHVFARPNFLVRNSLFYTTTTLDNAAVRISVLSH